MADIYSGAYIVLAATKTSDITKGFLQPRHEPQIIKSLTAKGQAFEVQARRVGSHLSRGSIPLDYLPLSLRGWCLQERLLATRTLHFTCYETLFGCKTSSFYECGVVDGTYNRSLRSWPPSEADYQDEDMAIFPSDSWTNLVYDYSARNFTFPEDVRPALS
jgi:hypothetical protein